MNRGLEASGQVIHEILETNSHLEVVGKRLIEHLNEQGRERWRDKDQERTSKTMKNTVDRKSTVLLYFASLNGCFGNNDPIQTAPTLSITVT